MVALVSSAFGTFSVFPEPTPTKTPLTEAVRSCQRLTSCAIVSPGACWPDSPNMAGFQPELTVSSAHAPGTFTLIRPVESFTRTSSTAFGGASPCSLSHTAPTPDAASTTTASPSTSQRRPFRERGDAALDDEKSSAFVSRSDAGSRGPGGGGSGDELRNAAVDQVFVGSGAGDAGSGTGEEAPDALYGDAPDEGSAGGWNHAGLGSGNGGSGAGDGASGTVDDGTGDAPCDDGSVAGDPCDGGPGTGEPWDVPRGVSRDDGSGTGDACDGGTASCGSFDNECDECDDGDPCDEGDGCCDPGGCEPYEGGTASEGSSDDEDGPGDPGDAGGA